MQQTQPQMGCMHVLRELVVAREVSLFEFEHDWSAEHKTLERVDLGPKRRRHEESLTDGRELC